MQPKLPWTIGRITSAFVFWLCLGVTALGLLIIIGSFAFGASAPQGVAEDRPGGLDGLLALIGLFYGAIMLLAGGVLTAFSAIVYYLVVRHLKKTIIIQPLPQSQPVIVPASEEPKRQP